MENTNFCKLYESDELGQIVVLLLDHLAEPQIQFLFKSITDGLIIMAIPYDNLKLAQAGFYGLTRDFVMKIVRVEHTRMERDGK